MKNTYRALREFELVLQELQPEHFEFPTEVEESLMGEVSRSRREYVRWVQSSLNRIVGLRLVVDGIMAPVTRSAIRSFQQRQGLTTDGAVGPQTERALIQAGASPPPRTAHTIPAASPIVIPPLIIRVRPFVVLDQFEFNRASLPAKHLPIIRRIAHLVVASQISAQPIRTIRLVGHTDPTGSASYNLGLGERRAKEVQKNLIKAIDDLSSSLSASITIVPQSLGETRAIASNRTQEGRARNRRVEVFVPTTCQSFFAQYDLRFLPSDPLFGIPANPNMTQAEKNRRSADVGKMVQDLVTRRDKRASDALAGNVSRTNPVPLDTAADSLHSVARRLSAAQIELYREFFPDGAGGTNFEIFQQCFEQFANGELRSRDPAAQSMGVGEPNGGFFFLFAEFAFLCIDSGIDAIIWTQALRVFVKCQEIFMHVYRPMPVSPPPPVGAALPTCPVDAQGSARPRRRLDDFRNGNFKQKVGQPANVGDGQSGQTRKDALRAKYGPMNIDALRRAAGENMRRAQCMS
jgi:outer membrane protein OmpA-like peptidoglycan-associated protein